MRRRRWLTTRDVTTRQLDKNSYPVLDYRCAVCLRSSMTLFSLASSKWSTHAHALISKYIWLNLNLQLLQLNKKKLKFLSMHDLSHFFYWKKIMVGKSALTDLKFKEFYRIQKNPTNESRKKHARTKVQIQKQNGNQVLCKFQWFIVALIAIMENSNSLNCFWLQK